MSPPPLLDELPPPPFPVALSAPVLDLPADGSIPSISTANQTELGSDSPSVTSPHEDTPLLHSSDSDPRPRSQASILSLELSENSETDVYQEDDAS